MIKRLIFDFDNTLIPWKDEYYITLNHALDKLHYDYDEEMIKLMIKAVNDYESKYQIYNKHDMLDLMNKYIDKNLPTNFIDLWLDELSLCYDKVSDEIINTLEYLHSKYDLVVLTNWFSSSQIKRLVNADLAKYFTHIYCADTFPIKPYLESFIYAIADYKPSECLMIGDSIKFDVEGALKAGMNAIYYNYDHINVPNNKDYRIINNFSELKDIL